MMTEQSASDTLSREPRRNVPATVAVFGTVAIYAAAAVLSFGALCSIAERSNVTVPELWPLIVDGVVLAATVAVVAGAGGYAWFLVVAGSLLSLAGNVLHSAIPDGPLPVFVRAIVAAVPPVALVAVAHLVVVLRRTSIQATAATTVDDTGNSGGDTPHRDEPLVVSGTDIHVPDISTSDLDGDTVATTVATLDQSPSDATAGDDDTKARAMEMLAAGITPREVAEQLGLHRATPYKWKKELAATV